MRLTSDPNHAAEDIVRVVDQDASLTIRLLRIANSPVIAPVAPIESVAHAVSLLGDRTVVSAALSIGANWMQAPLSGYGPDAKLFEIGLKTAVAARLVATALVATNSWRWPIPAACSTTSAKPCWRSSSSRVLKSRPWAPALEPPRLGWLQRKSRSESPIASSESVWPFTSASGRRFAR
ncbi:MAG: HDOD domain-containing protein [bacterium]|nr:HDOD domain-containing protein [bacterium]